MTDHGPSPAPGPHDGPAPAVGAAAGSPRRTIGSLGALLGYLGERAAAERGAGTVAGAGLWALFLDRDNRLLRDAGDWPDGDGRAAASPPRGLARRAVELGAAAVILVRRRPDDGGAEPTAADVEGGRRAHTALAALGVELHDYVVVAGGRCASLRDAGLLRGVFRMAGAAAAAARDAPAHGRPS